MKFIFALILTISTQCFAVNSGKGNIDVEEVRRIMKKTSTHYEILGVNQNATADEIKRAYRKLVSKYFPDHFSNNTSQREIVEAVSKKLHDSKKVLTDSITRKKYDSEIKVSPTAHQTAQETKWQPEDFGSKKSQGNPKKNPYEKSSESKWRPEDFGSNRSRGSAKKNPYGNSQESKWRPEEKANNGSESKPSTDTRADYSKERSNDYTSKQDTPKQHQERRGREAIDLYKGTKKCGDEVFSLIVDVFL